MTNESARLLIKSEDSIASKQGIIVPLILFILFTTNVIDRYVISSVLVDLQDFFDVSKSTAGLLQTIFFLSFTAASPFCGYLGDRFNRKYILLASVSLWIAATVWGSLCESDQFLPFCLSRALFGVASAGFETLAIPILGDLEYLNEQRRSLALTIYFMGPPIGVGLSYVLSLVSKKTVSEDDWRYVMRFTPVLLFLVLIIILIGYKEPKRTSNTQRTFKNDLISLLKNKTYLLLVFTWVCGIASLAAFNWWSATIIDYSLRVDGSMAQDIDTIKLFYSIFNPLFGVLGIVVSNWASNNMKKRFRSIQTSDCIIFSVCFLLASLFIYLYLTLIKINVYLSLVLFMLTIFSFNLCWLIKGKILLDIVEPNLRSTANSLRLFAAHSIGDDASPYWTGLIADYCLDERLSSTITGQLYCTRVSLYPLVFGTFIAASLALFTTLTFTNDKKKSTE